MAKKKIKSTATLFKNRRVNFDYIVTDKIEAGIKLTGTEVKSIRDGKVNLNGTFCLFIGGELVIRGMDIAIYDEASYNNHEPKRDRILLLHKKQLNKLKESLEQKGLTIVPTMLYLNEKGIFKMEIGLGKGRKTVDKRQYIKDRDFKREVKNL